MSRRKSPVFVGALTLCGVLALGEMYLIYERWSATRAAEAKLRQRESDLGAMASLIPPPSRAVATAIEADLARAQRALESMQGELKGRGPAAEKLRAAKVPPARTDAYFDLATYVEKMRELARKNDVGIQAEAARFGFASYATEGPEAERIEPVFRQRLIVQYLLESLLEAKPTVLLGVKREPTLTKAERTARDEALAAAAANAAAGQVADPSATPEVSLPEGPDYFQISPQASVRKPGFIDTEAFRFVFSGPTAALRTFLNRLAAFELPLLVREVEVVPATNEETIGEQAPVEEAPAASAADGSPSVVLRASKAPAKAPTKAARTNTSTPIVAKPISKFTVTVEYVLLVPPVTPPAEGEQPAPPPQS
ncbi:MAG: Amuc_1100 family pilus-like protein [Verrucomicrobiota bacterium]